MKALIVVDVQNDFCEGGNLPVEGGNVVASSIANLLRQNSNKYPYSVMAFTRDWHIQPGAHFALGGDPDYKTSWPVHCVAGTEGASFHDDILEVLRTDLWAHTLIQTFHKGMYTGAYSGFDGIDENEVPLKIWLLQHRVTEVDIAGLALDYCVKATAEDAVMGGFKTRVLRDYTAAVHPGKAEEVIGDLCRFGAEVV